MTSTSDVAKQLLKYESPDLPMLVLTDQQTAGRGQQDRSWWGGQGALTFSWVPNCRVLLNLQVISLAAAMAVTTAIESLSEILRPRIKWPNDVYVAQKKIAGILIESLMIAGSRNFVFGIGVNANNPLKDAPPEIRAIATSLIDTLGRHVDLNQLLCAIIVELQKAILLADKNSDEIIHACLDRSVLGIGESLVVKTAAGHVRGTFAGFGRGGQLLIQTNQSIEQIVSGTIVEI